MSRYGSTLFDVAVGVSATALGYVVPPLTLVLVLPGLVVALAVQLCARALGAGPAFDGDELPGPIAMAIGLVVNVIAWAVVTNALRRILRRRDT